MSASLKRRLWFKIVLELGSLLAPLAARVRPCPLQVPKVDKRAGEGGYADGQGVKMSLHVVLTAGSIATKDLESGGIYRGNPAIFLRPRIITQEKTPR